MNTIHFHAPSSLLRAVPAALMLSLAACGGGGGGDSASDDPRALSLDFAVTAAGQPVGCGTTLPPMGTAATPSSLKDLRFYISELSLLDTKGNAIPVSLDQNEWQAYNVALLDFEDASGSCAGGTPETHGRITGSIPAGDYVGVRMVLGVPMSGVGADGKTVALNHSDTAAARAPLDIQAMGWSWQAGRKFTKIEVNPTGGLTKPDGSTAATFNFHLGSTGCTGNPASGETVSCAAPNRVSLRFDQFNPDTQKLVLDLAKLYSGSNLAVDGGGPTGCMSGKSDPECPAMFSALQLSLDSGLTLGEGRSQNVFSVAAK